MKNSLLAITFLTSLPLFTQTQYDYYDEDAVVSGVDRVLHGVLIIGGIAIVFVVRVLLLGGIS